MKSVTIYSAVMVDLMEEVRQLRTQLEVYQR